MRELGEKKDVKNEGRTDYVHENTGADDKMYSDHQALLDENAPLMRPSERARISPSAEWLS
jgi:hypothetical protein